MLENYLDRKYKTITSIEFTQSTNTENAITTSAISSFETQMSEEIASLCR
jgi:hypothetical protein